MGRDLSSIDTELAGLGPEPQDLEALCRQHASTLDALEEVDRVLSELAMGLAQPLSEPAAEPRLRVTAGDPASDPASGEITLAEPVRRRTDPASAELALLDLDNDDPGSGLFELDEEETHARGADIDLLARGASEPSGAVIPISVNRDESWGAAREVPPFALDPWPSIPHGSSGIGAHEEEPDTQDVTVGRDPDAEFDALFDDATRPSGLPGAPRFDTDEGIPSQGDLLRALTGPDQTESDAATNALYAELSSADRTDLVDASTVTGYLDPLPAAQELDSSEFEIVLDEVGDAGNLVRSQPPDAVEPDNRDKRPSFLGRLFGRKDDKP